MWETLIILLIPALLVAIAGKALFSKQIDNRELILHFVISFFVGLFSLLIIAGVQQGRMYDTEVWSGYVTGKERNKVSCSHSYSCNCRQTCSGSGNSRSCSTTCDTCYDHSYDVDWDIKSTIGTFSIDREDRQGLTEPKRWSVVNQGDAVADERSYSNPLLLDKDSLFLVDKTASASFAEALPAYPRTYDYYKIKRVVGSPIVVKSEEVEFLLSEYLKVNASVKQLNIITVFTEYSPEYFNALMAHWNGGKKNDVILVYGLAKDGTIKWFNSNSYAKGMNNRGLHTEFRQVVLGEKLSLNLLTSQIKLVHNGFNRLSTEEFNYKLEQVETPAWLIAVLFILNLCISAVITFKFKTN